MARDQRRKVATDYPALGRFLDGYLHQDFRTEHRTATAAATAFTRDASARELEDLIREFTRLREAITGTKPAEWQATIERIGGAWRPPTLAAVDRVIAALRRGPG